MLQEISEYDIVNGVPMTRFDGVSGSKLYLVNTKTEWEAFFDLLMQQKLVACDTETTGFEWFKGAQICGLSFGWRDTHFYIPTRHEESLLGGAPPPQLSMDFLRDDLTKFFSQTDVFTIWHNAKFDYLFYLADGIEIKTPFHDTVLLWKLYDENAPAALKSIASGWRDLMGRWHKGLVDKDANSKEKLISRWRTDEARERRKHFTKLVMARADELQTDPAFQKYNRNELKKWIKEQDLADHPYKDAAKDEIHYGVVPVGMMCEYAGLDTFLTWKLYHYLGKNLPMGPKLRSLYLNELKLTKALISAQREGVKIDREYTETLSKTFGETIDSIQQDLTATLGPINLNSNQQLAKAFLGRGVKLTKKTESSAKCPDCLRQQCDKHYAMNADILKEIAKVDSAAKGILDLRKVIKLKNTYTDSILEKLTDDDILHCSFNQNVSTGRMSADKPNLMNIPGKDDSIRRAFIVPGDEWLYLLCDYSQIEVRLTAHFSQDPLLLDAYAKDQDIHTRTMCEMFALDYDTVQDVLKINEDKSHPKYKEWNALRNTAKVLNFSIIYGSGAKGLSEQIPRPERYRHLSNKEWINVCQNYIDNYLDKYRGVRKFINRAGRKARSDLYVENVFGRVRHLPHARATKITGDYSLAWMEGKAQRQAANYIIQSAAADLFKHAVVRVHELLKPKKSKAVNFVHDEIQIYLHKSELDLLPKIKHCMEDFPQFTVPIIADIEYSETNWADKRGI